MFFKQLYLGCLAQASYLIGSEGEAVVVDPRRDVDVYIDEAAAQGLKIGHIIETHLHADFVSGHCELAKRTGARIYLGHKSGAAFAHVPVHDGDEIAVGQVVLRFLETPGHTPESICVLVTDRAVAAEPQMVLTGDTLFIGDVGRPDLVGSKGYSSEDMAGMLYDSLREKILKLPDAVVVYPAHGAGSACGKNISKDTYSTLGEQRRSNYALKEMTREEFVKVATCDLSEPPRYFGHDAELNRLGASALGELAPLKAMAPAEIEVAVGQGIVLLDVRDAQPYRRGHVPGSLNLGLKGQFASWAGSLFAPRQAFVLVADDAPTAAEARMRLARVGLENVMGYLDGGVDAWSGHGRTLASLRQMEVGDLKADRDRGAELQVIDVRRPGEHQAGHVPGALNLPLDQLEHSLGRLDSKRPVAIVCQSGYRSSAAASLLARAGFSDLANVVGGTAAWIQAGLPTEP